MSRRSGLVAMIALCSGGLSHAAAPPVFGPELDVDMPVLTSAVGDQTVAAAAFDGERFLVAWRTALWKNELRVGRVTAAGEVQDPRGLLLDGFERLEGRVAVAAGGGTFLVAWGNPPGGIRAARVSIEGGRLVAGPTVTLADGPATTTATGPAVAWNGSGFWVMWGQNDTAAGVYATRMSAAGAVLDATPIKLAATSAEPALVWDGTQVVAAWAAPAAGGVEVRAVRLRADGSVLEPAGLPVLTLPRPAPGPLSLAWDGSTYLVTGAGLDADGGQQLRAARIAADWRVLDPGGIDVAAPPGVAVGGPTALATGNGFTVLWSSAVKDGNRMKPGLSGSAIAGGQATSLPAFGWSAAGQMPFLALAGTEPFVFWSEVGWFTKEGLLIDLDVQAGPLGGQRPPVLISRGINGQFQPVVTLGGDQLMVAWEDRRADRENADVYAARLSTTGAMLDPGGLAVGDGPGPQVAPAVAWDGRNFVVAWRDGERGLAVGRVSTTGMMLDKPALLVPGTAGQRLLADPTMCADGDGVLLAWGARAPGAPAAEIRAIRLGRGAAVTDATSVVLVQTADAMSPPVIRLGCNQQAAVLVWTGNLVPMDRVPMSMLHLARGKLAPTAPPQVLQPAEGDEWAGIGSDGTDFLISWRNFDGGRRTVVGQRVAADGRLLDERPFRIGVSNAGNRVTALWDGSQYLVFAINTAGGKPFELRARRVARNGDPLEEDWIPIAPLAQPWAGTGNGSDGVMLSPGRTFLVYDRYHDEDATGHVRIRGRFITSTPPDPPDAGIPPPADAGASLSGDAAPDAPTIAPASGCSCQTSSGSPSGLVLVLVLVLGRLLRRAHDPRDLLRPVDHADDR